MAQKKRTKGRRKGSESGARFYVITLALLAILLACAYVLHKYYRDNPIDSLPTPVVAPDSQQGKVLGIDISHHNGRIDWKKVKSAGITFAYIKVSEGTTHLNRRFTNNYDQAKAAGLKCGVYHFFSYNKSGKEQAQHFLQNLCFEYGDLPPVVDIEYVKSSYRKTDAKIIRQRKWEIASFDSVIYDAIGIHPVIYTNEECYRDLIDQTSSDSSDLWICDIVHKTPSSPRPWTIWQYKHDGKVGGIRGNVDLNVFNGNHDNFLAWINSYR